MEQTYSHQSGITHAWFIFLHAPPKIESLRPLYTAFKLGFYPYISVAK